MLLRHRGGGVGSCHGNRGPMAWRARLRSSNKKQLRQKGNELQTDGQTDDPTL